MNVRCDSIKGAKGEPPLKERFCEIVSPLFPLGTKAQFGPARSGGLIGTQADYQYFNAFQI
jgi:hypothetical protein